LRDTREPSSRMWRRVTQRDEAIEALRPLTGRTISTGWGAAARVGIRGLAYVRAARVAVAIERYRLATGTLPDSLADLVPEYVDTLPGDPFVEGPMRYRRADEGDGYVVYSVGADQTDNDAATVNRRDQVFAPGGVAMACVTCGTRLGDAPDCATRSSVMLCGLDVHADARDNALSVPGVSNSAEGKSDGDA